MLSVDGITVGYGAFVAIRDISLTIGEGEVVAVVGPNGAGKTTLLKTISGLLHPQSGTIRFEGEPIHELPAHRILDYRIAHVPENRRLFPKLTVEENLKIGAYPKAARKEWRERMDEMFGLFPILAERREQAAGSLSGGEQQMCAIARALMSSPKLLMMDEPSAGLAPIIVNQVFDLVQHIKRAGMTIIIVEQNVREILAISDRAYVLEAGVLRGEGNSEELLNSDILKKAYLGSMTDGGERE